jgi:Trm5-related predicted tRNA methylase
MAKTVSELAREIIRRLDQGEPLESAISMVLTGEGVEDEVLVELQVAGLRDAVIHEAFHELLDWHANFGGLAEFLEIDRTAERIGHDFDQDLPDHPTEPGARLVH